MSKSLLGFSLTAPAMASRQAPSDAPYLSESEDQGEIEGEIEYEEEFEAWDSAPRRPAPRKFPLSSWQRQGILVVIALLGALYQVRKASSIFESQDEEAARQLELAGSHLGRLADADLQFFIGQAWHPPQDSPAKTAKKADLERENETEPQTELQNQNQNQEQVQEHGEEEDEKNGERPEMMKSSLSAAIVAAVLASTGPASGVAVETQTSMLRTGEKRSMLWGWWGDDDDDVECPSVPPVDDFDLDTWTAQSWYIHAQQETAYQESEFFYCVVATYETQDNYVEVLNYATNANQSEIQQSGGNFFSNLCARQLETGSGDLEVAPCFLRYLGWVGAGPYTVILKADDYSWAVVSGGQPTEVEQTDPVLCTTKTDTTNGSGLWIFTRSQTRDDDLVEDIKSQLEDMGVYTGLLQDVSQEGCTYEGTTLK
ncbi:Hypothetical Protein FCC1311_089322 [Hondaea fermentalgiana]|uniref:Uncharacterized protein n=1 Tax=Hondaea fermentalgiana TaxID=2315210 RepID=A0A2R5GPB3_9STRA|nr:Hypothetical Protein FCC1311_089322 [Hondaea fermentalgiana]|eukprot:GBG32707.1 Hypothetical Protein FCC1311_089322 [Hondaea fermentalgiana]